MDELAKLPKILADAQVARRQSKYGRDPTGHQRSRLVILVVNKTVKGIKLNAQVPIKNLQSMHEKSLPPTGVRRRMEIEYQRDRKLHLQFPVTQDWARLQGRAPHTGGHNDRLVAWRMWLSLGTDKTPPVDSTQIDRLQILP